MIDVLFVLVLFFMVTTTFAEISSLDVNLPGASAKSTQIAKKDLTLSLTRDGKIFLAENDAPPKELNFTTLKSELARLKASGADLSLVLKADKSVEHGTVVSVLDNAKQAGMERISIATVTQSGN